MANRDSLPCTDRNSQHDGFGPKGNNAELTCRDTTTFRALSAESYSAVISILLLRSCITVILNVFMESNTSVTGALAPAKDMLNDCIPEGIVEVLTLSMLL